jgi:hypothetical protein
MRSSRVKSCVELMVVFSTIQPEPNRQRLSEIWDYVQNVAVMTGHYFLVLVKLR